MTFIQRPWAFLLLLTALGIDLISLPPGSVAGTLVRELAEGASPRGCRRGWDFLLLREGEGERKRFIMLNPFSEDRPDRDSPNVLQAMHSGSRREVGLWAATTEVHSVRLAFWNFADHEIVQSGSPDYLPACAALADGLDALGWGERFSSDLVRAGGGTRSVAIPLGLAHNLLSAAVFGLLLLSARGALPSLRAHIARVHTAAPAKPTHCTFCGYSREGLPGPLCPECGGLFEAGDFGPALAPSPSRAS